MPLISIIKYTSIQAIFAMHSMSGNSMAASGTVWEVWMDAVKVNATVLTSHVVSRNAAEGYIQRLIYLAKGFYNMDHACSS